MRNELEKLRSSSKAAINDVRKDYDKKLRNEKNQLEVKLIGIRKKNNEIIKDEKKRFDKIINELQANHEAKLTELEISHSKEIEKREQEHREYLDNSKAQFESEKARLEA